MKTRFYTLNRRGAPVAQPDLKKWARWFDGHSDNRKVKQENIGDTFVSTVFLGLDHNWGKGPPILWETMCFGGEMDDEMARCSGSREQAEAMHERMVSKVKSKRTKI